MGIPLVALMGRQPQILDYGQQMAQAQQIQAMKNQNALAPGQLQGQQQQLQLGQQQIEENKRLMAERQALNDAYKNAITTDENGQPQIDINGVSKALTIGGHGSAVPSIVAGFTEMQKARQGLLEQTQKITEAHADLLGHAAYAIKQAGYDNAVAHATLNGLGNTPEIQQLHKLADSDPAQFKTMVDSAYAAAPFYQKQQGEEAVAKIRAAGTAKEGELPLGPEKVTQLNQALQGLYQVRNPGKPLPPEFSLPANATQKDYDRLEKITQTTETAAGTVAQQQANRVAQATTQANLQANRADTRADKSYQFAAGQIDKVGKPIEDAVARFGRLQDTLGQKTPQADALIAPELLTVMAGGAGSGLRMNEAEISRIVGGRSNVESLKAALNKWQLDPSKALSITDSQRGQIQALMNEVHGKLLQKQSILDDSRQALNNATSPDQHRKIITDTHKKLTQIDTGGGAPANAAPATGKALSMAAIQKAAKDNGVSVDEATKQAKAAGYTVQ